MELQACVSGSIKGLAFSISRHVPTGSFISGKGLLGNGVLSGP